ncbi:MATE family efflux transporter [Dethiothermospora halolimnae]|uniref:MATE family efflux transporter n=1 Tax=Dethiothermospora halolimnae TaxID=3114390 RepID=UPI003CCC38D7
MGEMTSKVSKKRVRKKIYGMILPIATENILQMTAGFISTGMLGRIGKVAISSFGISDRIIKILWALFKGITTGASVFVAQAYGSNNLKKLRKVVQQTLLSVIIVGIVLQQVIFWNAQRLLQFIYGPKPDILLNAVTYLKTVSWGIPFLGIMLVVAGVLQGMGNARTPMIIAFIMNIFNICFGYGLIFGNFGLPVLGIKGAAMAMAIGQFVAAMIGLYVLFNKKGVLGSLYNGNFFKIDIKQIASVYKLGAPTAFESIFWNVGSILLIRVILGYGDVAMASYQLGLQAEAISYMPAAGFSIAATAFIGQALGARDKKLGKTYLKETIKGSFMVTSISVILLVFFPKVILRLLTDEQEVINLGAKYLILMGLVQIPQNMSGVLNGALRGAGYTRVPMFVAGVGIWLIRIPFSYLLAYIFDLGIMAIWSVMCVDLVVRFLMSLTLYKKKDIYETELVFEE